MLSSDRIRLGVVKYIIIPFGLYWILSHADRTRYFHNIQKSIPNSVN